VSARLCKKLRIKFLETAERKKAKKKGRCAVSAMGKKRISHRFQGRAGKFDSGWGGIIKKEMTYHELVKLLEQIIVQCDCLFDRLDDEIVCGCVGMSPHGDVGWWDIANQYEWDLRWDVYARVWTCESECLLRNNGWREMTRYTNTLGLFANTSKKRTRLTSKQGLS
jgi:hypothetical protein